MNLNANIRLSPIKKKEFCYYIFVNLGISKFRLRWKNTIQRKALTAGVNRLNTNYIYTSFG